MACYRPITPTNVDSIDVLQSRLNEIGFSISSLSLDNKLFSSDEWKLEMKAVDKFVKEGGAVTVWQSENGQVVVVVLLLRDQISRFFADYVWILDDARRNHGAYIVCVKRKTYSLIERCLFAE